MERKTYSAVGRRKEATAQVKIKSGTGKIIVNELPVEEYLKIDKLVFTAKLPLTLTSSENSYDIIAKIKGGGQTGQVDALKLGIARALILVNPKFRPILKKKAY